jgi:ribokinase
MIEGMSNVDKVKAVVIGGLNTDIVALGIKDFPAPGGYVLADKMHIGPGGKSRNIADMLAHLLPPQSVAMAGRTTKDPYDLWKLPVEALKKSAVNTDYIYIDEFNGKDMPGLCLIPVTKEGKNQIFFAPGIRYKFSPEDIDKAQPLFNAAAKQNGVLVMSLECPVPTAAYAINKAHNLGIKVICDPGGIEAGTNFMPVLKAGVFLLKPNEDEAELMTGIKPINEQSAQQAANKLQAYGIENVMITLGVKGAYLFTPSESIYIPIPNVKAGEVKDETGCGDQTTAALSASLIAGKNLKEAARIAVGAGTLQFHKPGIQPVTTDELKVLE